MKPNRTATGDLADPLDTLVHWEPAFREWKRWEDVPEHTRRRIAEEMEREALEQAGKAARVHLDRPRQAAFDAMWARVYQLAAEKLR